MIRLEKVNSHNVWKLLKLEVNEDQKNFVATNTESIIEAYTTIAANGVALPFGIYDDDVPVGFLMIGYGVDDEWGNGPKIAEGNYCIWRLMIDKNHQGKGYGRRTMELALDYIKTMPLGKAEYVYLSFEPENVKAKKMYESFGFSPNGEMDDEEIVMVKKL